MLLTVTWQWASIGILILLCRGFLFLLFSEIIGMQGETWRLTSHWWVINEADWPLVLGSEDFTAGILEAHILMGRGRGPVGNMWEISVQNCCYFKWPPEICTCFVRFFFSPPELSGYRDGNVGGWESRLEKGKMPPTWSFVSNLEVTYRWNPFYQITLKCHSRVYAFHVEHMVLRKNTGC